MRYLSLFLIFCLSCGDPGSQNSGVSQQSSSSSQPSSEVPAANATSADKTLPEKHNCTIQGQLLEENDCYLRTAQTLVCIVADSTTQDLDFGESHRVLAVYNTKDCSLLSKTTLPVNYSPDYPYYLSPKTYEPKNQVICTQGFEYTYCYDVAAQRLMPKMEAQFLSERAAEDAQSGSPQGLVIWEQYLFAHAQDQGAYAFDLSDKAAVKPFLPNAEFVLPNRSFEYHSLFLLPVGEDRYQAIVPRIEEEEFQLELVSLFEQARKIDPTLAKNVQNNRFLIFKDLDSEQRLAIDLQAIKLVDLPTDIASKKTGEILQWLRQNG